MSPWAGRLTIAAIAVAGILAGGVAGWAVKPTPPPPAAQAALIADVLDTLDDAEKRTMAVIEILNDMLAGNASPTVIEGVRDSMQEVLEAVGDVKSQLVQLRR